jgi:hypothetical protein
MSSADSSYISRRRLASSPGIDIEIDDLDFFDAPTAQAPARSSQGAKPVDPARIPRHAPAAVPRGTRKWKWLPSWPVLLGLALFAIGVGSAAGLAARGRDARRRAHSPAPLATPLAAPLAAPPPPAALPVPPPAAPAASAPPAASTQSSAPEVPVVDVANLPRPHDGVVTGSPGHRLWIDGTLAPSWKVSLPCGPHLVQVGSAGAARKVDVPCGSVVMVSP